MIPGELTELAELRDTVNTSRAILRGLQNQARAASRLAAALEEQLEQFDNRLRQRQAMEAQHDQHHQQHRVPV